MLYFDARLSEGQPTLEVRILDVVTDVQDVVLLAALVRALVETAASGWAVGAAYDAWRSEELRAATWRAARFGLSGTLVDPVGHGLSPARAVLESLVDLVGDRLRANGDEHRVRDGVARVLAGTGATRQRSALEAGGGIESGVEGVVDDLVRRTRDSVSVGP
jgi:carboxylate-amine ligase